MWLPGSWSSEAVLGGVTLNDNCSTVFILKKRAQPLRGGLRTAPTGTVSRHEAGVMGLGVLLGAS